MNRIESNITVSWLQSLSPQSRLGRRYWEDPSDREKYSCDTLLNLVYERFTQLKTPVSYTTCREGVQVLSQLRTMDKQHVIKGPESVLWRIRRVISRCLNAITGWDRNAIMKQFCCIDVDQFTTCLSRGKRASLFQVTEGLNSESGSEVTQKCYTFQRTKPTIKIIHHTQTNIITLQAVGHSSVTLTPLTFDPLKVHFWHAKVQVGSSEGYFIPIVYLDALRHVFPNLVQEDPKRQVEIS